MLGFAIFCLAMVVQVGFAARAAPLKGAKSNTTSGMLATGDVSGRLRGACTPVYQNLPRAFDPQRIVDGHVLKADNFSFHLDPNRPIYLIHIAKCAGGSAQKSIEAIVKRAGGFFGSQEFCFEKAKLSNAANTQFVTFLRSPRTHVVSQFFMLKNKGGWCRLIPEESGEPIETPCCSHFPKVSEREALKLWLNWYNESDWEPRTRTLTPQAKKSKHFGNYLGSCYTPWNMQSRAMTCVHEQMHRACSAKDSVPSIQQAIQKLEEHAFVGLVELFSESMCLFEYRLTGKLPQKCTCSHKHVLWSGFRKPTRKRIHESGGKPYEHDKNHAATIDRLTRVDTELYRAGVLRFIRDMRRMEVESGSRVICPGHMNILKKEVAHIDGLWESVLEEIPENYLHETDQSFSLTTLIQYTQRLFGTLLRW